MKTSKLPFILAIVTFISVISLGVCTIWTLVEFIIYLVKDKEFNWMSLYSTIGSSIVILIALIWSFFDVKKTTKEPDQELKKKSKFQQKLNELHEKRNKG